MRLLRAFLVLLWGPDEMIGNGYRWKRSVFSLAIIGTVAMPLFFVEWAGPFQGVLPPQATVITAAGRFLFESEYGSRKIPIVIFKSTDDKIYQVVDGAHLDLVRRRQLANPGEKFLVNGFLLRNGRGYFWPLSVRSLNGTLLVDPDSQMKILKRARNPFGWKIFWMCVVVFPLWWLSFRNAAKIDSEMN